MRNRQRQQTFYAQSLTWDAPWHAKFGILYGIHYTLHKITHNHQLKSFTTLMQKQPNSNHCFICGMKNVGRCPSRLLRDGQRRRSK